jgi:uncharacterized membrane protein
MKKYKLGKFEFDVYTIVVLVLTIVAFVLRVWNVDYLTLWVDEYVHVVTASAFLHETPPDNNGILYTWMMIPFFRLFGETEFWSRFPSVILGALSIPLLYVFGKKYFNRQVGLFAAVLLTVSQYHIFWSRIARFYAIWMFFFLLFAVVLGETMNVKNDWKPIKNKIFNYLRCTPKNLIVTILLFLLALISNQMTFLVIYSVGFYHFVLFLVRLYHKKYRFLSFNAIISYGFLFFCAMTFVPAFQNFLKVFIFILFPEGIWNFLPQLDRIKVLMDTQPYEIFQMYLAVLKTDFPKLWVIGIIGCLWGFVRFRKSALFNFSLSVVLFLLMSFVYREPALPRYIIYLYPFFLIGISVIFYEIVYWSKRFVFKKYPESSVWILLLVLLFLSPIKQSWAMVNSKKHGEVVPKALSVWYFTDWKTSTQKVKQQLQPNDVIISTIVQPMQFYLHRKEIVRFRQMFYNAAEYKYDKFPVDTITSNANSTQALAKLLNSTDRAWLLADYYFNNVMTDPETRAYVLQNMRFEYDMSNEYVSVFSWDKAHPMTQPSGLFEFIHTEHPGSYPYQFQVPEGTSDVQMVLEVEGITRDNEMLVNINGNTFGISRQSGEIFRQNGDSKSRQYYSVQVPRKILQTGVNQIAFGLNDRGKRAGDRFVVHNLF